MRTLATLRALIGRPDVSLALGGLLAVAGFSMLQTSVKGYTRAAGAARLQLEAIGAMLNAHADPAAVAEVRDLYDVTEDGAELVTATRGE